MKYKSYKDSNEQLTTGLNTELLDQSDIISARNINRPIINLEENQETDYTLLQTLLKTVYGDSNGILPDVQEEFIPETFQVGSFKSDTSTYYIRLPLGAMLLSKSAGDEFDINDDNPFSAQGEYKYKDGYGKDSFLKDKLHSYIVESKPEINLFERQLASYIGLDLSYLTNDIKIYQEMVPFAIKVAVVDEDTKQIKLKSDGSPMYLQEDFSGAEESESNIIYLAKPGEGNLTIRDGNTDVEVYDYNFVTSYEKRINSVTPSLTNDVILQYVNFSENLKVVDVGEGNGNYTTDINKAVTLKDSNGETKYRSGYYLNVVRATDNEDEVTWLPNKAENAHFDIFMPMESGNPTITVEINKTTSSDTAKNYSFEFDIENEDADHPLTQKEVNEQFYNAAYSALIERFDVEKIQEKRTGSNDEYIYGTRITFKSRNEVTNFYTISVKNGSTPVTDIKGETLNEVEVIVKKNQKYYDNVFDLTNSFFGKFQSYLTNIGEIYDYLNFEVIAKINARDADVNLHVYYDLNGNLDNQITESGEGDVLTTYDKTGRFCFSEREQNGNNFIKLFDITISAKSVAAPYTVAIKKVHSYLPNLDRRTIATKRAELSTLLVNSRADLRNYFLLRDNDGNRTIELTENFDEPDKEQVRYASPITRITDAIETDTLQEKNTNTWEDTDNGDTPSDFFEEAYYHRDFNTNVEDYKQHNDESNKGIIIDRNKGLRIFNNSGLINHPFSYGDLDNNSVNINPISERYTRHGAGENLSYFDILDLIEEYKNDAMVYSSYSEYQPLEIISKFGNINILTSDYDKARINIRNVKDSDNNIIDLFGRTRVRSSQLHPLVVRKIKLDGLSATSSSIAFVTGKSYSKDDEDAFGLNVNTPDNIMNVLAGYIDFTTGPNKINQNRTFSIYITPPEKDGTYLDSQNVKRYYENRAFSIRNTFNEGNYFTATLNGDLVPTSSDGLLGYPVNSRTYSETNIIPYTKYLDNESRFTGFNDERKINSEGTLSARLYSNENRWLAAFVKYGYFGKINLADVSTDIVNNDARDGVLRLGNSNIFDVSSIYINQTNGRLNFDNAIALNSENTIQSWYEEDNLQERNGFSFILNRKLGMFDKPTYTSEDNINFNALYISPMGTYVNKNLEVTRQLFVNNHSRSSSEDNSALVVKGQTISQGELIIDKSDRIQNSGINDTNLNAVTRNKDHKHKYYDFEFFTIHENDGDNYDDRAYDETNKIYKRASDVNLFTLVNKGKTLLDGNVKITGDFENRATFQKSLVIENKKIATYKYNEATSNIPVNDPNYFDSVQTDNYYSDFEQLPRNNISFDVKSGKIVFGSDYSPINQEADKSDVLLHGSQFIRRRLEISEDGDTLIGTKKVYGKLLNIYYYKNEVESYNATPDFVDNGTGGHDTEKSRVSPTLLVNGATHITGDVVFGHKPYYNSIDNYYYLPNIKAIEDENKNPIKAIFWGANESAMFGNNTRDWRSDFDFHGKTWFDNSVEIGTNNDLRYNNSNEKDNKNEGNLSIYGKDSPAALHVEGNINLVDGEDFNLENEEITITAKSGEEFSSIHMKGEEESFELLTDSGNQSAIFNNEEIEIKDIEKRAISLISGDVDKRTHIQDPNDEDEQIENPDVGKLTEGSRIKLEDKAISIESESLINASTEFTTIKSSNHILNAGKLGDDEKFTSEISRGANVISSIKQENDEIEINANESIKLNTKDYSITAKVGGEEPSAGSITEDTRNKTVKVFKNYTENEDIYSNTAKTSWKVNIGSEDSSEQIFGNGNSWNISHGTSSADIKSSAIELKTANTDLKLNNSNNSITLSTDNNNKLILNSDTSALLKNTAKVDIIGKNACLDLCNNSITLSYDNSESDGSTLKKGIKIYTDSNNKNYADIISDNDNCVQINDGSGNGNWKQKNNINFSANSNKTQLELSNSQIYLKRDTSSLTIKHDEGIKLVHTSDNQLNIKDSSTFDSKTSFVLTTAGSSVLSMESNDIALKTGNNNKVYINSDETGLVSGTNNYLKIKPETEMKSANEVTIQASSNTNLSKLILGGSKEDTKLSSSNGKIYISLKQEISTNDDNLILGTDKGNTLALGNDDSGTYINLDAKKINISAEQGTLITGGPISLQSNVIIGTTTDGASENKLNLNDGIISAAKEIVFKVGQYSIVISNDGIDFRKSNKSKMKICETGTTNKVDTILFSDEDGNGQKVLFGNGDYVRVDTDNYLYVNGYKVSIS